MIDLDKEEFLQRLDIRIATISALICTHEKYLCRDVPRKDYIEVQRSIDRLNQELVETMHDVDRKTKNAFAKLKEKIAKENCENE
jgi:N12 class adenine-specific DNA methylase